MAQRDLKFEVRLNGRMVCRIGPTLGYPHLCAEITHRVDSIGRGTKKSSCRLGVAASFSNTFDTYDPEQWLLTDVHVGDVIRIRLVDEGDLSEPLGKTELTRVVENHAGEIVKFPGRNDSGG